MKRKFYKILIGHNRYATQGAHTEENAHPFECGSIVGAHNGTLDAWSDIQPVKGGTDSEAIFWSINEIGVDATIAKMSGAWALVWFDAKDNTLNMIRNSKRPLTYAYDKERKVIAWASERRMLEFTLHITDGIFSPSDDILYTWDLTSDSKPLSAPKQRLLVGKPEAAKKGNWFQNNFGVGGYGAYDDEYYAPAYKGAKESSAASSSDSKTTTAVIIPLKEKMRARQKDKRKNFRPPYIDQGGRVINKAEFEIFTEEGCAFCQEAFQAWGDEVHVLGSYQGKMTSYICGECAADDDIFDVVLNSV